MSPSNIEWTEETWNPVTGCSHVSEGCRHCYAESLSLRRGWSTKPWTAQNASDNVRLHHSRLPAPLHWQKPRVVFVNSMSDLFHDLVPDEFIDRVFAVMAFCGRHTFQVLTKRAKRMQEYVRGLADYGGDGRGFRRLRNAGRELGLGLEFQGIPLVRWPVPNVWLGVSVEDQRNADERIPHLVRTPAAIRFLSCEPLLGEIELRPAWNRGLPWLGGDDGIRWVIAGGESGTGYRAMDVDWAASLSVQCGHAGVPFFMKQDSGPRPGIQGRLPDWLWAQKQMPQRQAVPA